MKFRDKVKIKYITLIFIPHVALAQIIYGVDAIPHYQHTKNFPVYVQVASFKNKHYAENKILEVQTKNHQKATIKFANNLYKVVIGPFNNQATLMSCYYNFHGTHVIASSSASPRSLVMPNKTAASYSAIVHNHVFKPPKVVLKKREFLKNHAVISFFTIGQRAKHSDVKKQYNHHKQPQHKIYSQRSRLGFGQTNKIESDRVCNKAENHALCEGRGSSAKSILNHWYINGQLGGQFINSKSSATVNNGSGFSSPYNLDTYSASSKNASTLLGIGLGKRFLLNRSFLQALSIGVHYQYFFANNITGNITQFSLPQFVNYSYTWPMAANVLVANSKWNFQDYKRFSPYLSVGLGGVFQQSSGYSENAYTNVTPRISPAFAGNDKAKFAYLLGAGLDYPINNKVILSAGYQFSGLGNAQSGKGQSSWATERLNFGNLNANAFIFSAAYLFDADFAHFKLFNDQSDWSTVRETI